MSKNNNKNESRILRNIIPIIINSRATSTLSIILKRIIPTIISAVTVSAIKWKRGNLGSLPIGRRKQVLLIWLRNTGSLIILNALFPILKKYVKYNTIIWSIITAFASVISSNIPAELVSYVLIESIFDHMKIYLKKFDEHFRRRIRQILTCILLPILWDKYKGSNRTEVPSLFKLIFNHRPILSDFLLYYLLWNIKSFYKYIKSLLFDAGPHSRPSSSSSNSSNNTSHFMMYYNNHDELPTVSSTLRPVIHKLGEMYELASNNDNVSKHGALLERIFSSSFVTNIQPCIQWCLWKLLLVHTLRLNSKNCSTIIKSQANIMKSMTLILGIFVLDRNNNTMNIRTEVIRYFLNILLNFRISKLYEPERKVLLFCASLLAFKNNA
ncbi:Pex35p NDAI_0D02080 [Naumovozyma dairenensis CBS 421]|uniref:Uncharacterized protein n=1 Tax=Naumovozyma dairenensis (strain ATCC 10597 / BCRC 20456 / CBS 421 / NBRC 0211 / NRRL Y-12639) TaxID=1071378 RepID=G0W9R1_NAUDC|nr:hypothetical protein NDAI_0D02080 [Naumovozyma dairenensis CBS 421]CCD24522.1 hypothetical protein NDAI_0D02080 [Naumovozyma dairenensis CBS 421]